MGVSAETGNFNGVEHTPCMELPRNDNVTTRKADIKENRNTSYEKASYFIRNYQMHAARKLGLFGDAK